jgi:Flp pilus assembly protein TadB
MSDFDLERLGDVWRQQPDPAEMERLQRTAAAVSRRARFAHVVDNGAAVAVAGVMILLVLANPTPRTVLMGAAAIVILLIGQIRQRRHRLVELRALTGSTEDMLAQSVARIEATLKRTRFSLFAIGPGLALGWIFMNAVTEAPVRNLLHSLDDPLVRYLWIGGLLVLLVAWALYLMRAIRRDRHELERLTAMRDAYREERESSVP